MLKVFGCSRCLWNRAARCGLHSAFLSLGPLTQEGPHTWPSEVCQNAGSLRFKALRRDLINQHPTLWVTAQQPAKKGDLLDAGFSLTMLRLFFLGSTRVPSGVFRTGEL